VFQRSTTANNMNVRQYHLKCLLLLSDFNQNQNMSTIFFFNFTIIRVAGLALFRADFREMDGQTRRV